MAIGPIIDMKLNSSSPKCTDYLICGIYGIKTLIIKADYSLVIRQKYFIDIIKHVEEYKDEIKCIEKVHDNIYILGFFNNSMNSIDSDSDGSDFFVPSIVRYSDLIVWD